VDFPFEENQDRFKYVGNQEYFEDQQECANQGKYSMGLPWCPIQYIIYLLCMCLILLDYKDILAIDDLYLDPYGFYCIWVEC
jgi:hypothetical protein